MEQLELDGLGVATTVDVGITATDSTYFVSVVQEFSNEPEDYVQSFLTFKTREELVAFVNELQDKVRKL